MPRRGSSLLLAPLDLSRYRYRAHHYLLVHGLTTFDMTIYFFADRCHPAAVIGEVPLGSALRR